MNDRPLSVKFKICIIKLIVLLKMAFHDLIYQPHLAQCYSRRIALMLNGVHESKIYFEVQLDVN